MVKELDCIEAFLFPLPNKTFLACAQELFVLEGDELRSDPAYQRGIEREEPRFLWSIASMTGSWPNAVWLGTNRTTVSAAYGEFFRWTGSRWKKVGDAKPHEEALSELLPWTEQRAAALVQPYMVHGARMVPLGSKPFLGPQFTRPPMAREHCASRVRVQAHAVLSPGDVMVAGGAPCDVVLQAGVEEPVFNGIGVERLRAGMPNGELVILKGVPENPEHSDWEVTGLVALGPSEVLLAAHARVDKTRNVSYFARWQGAAFVGETSPIDGVVNRLWLEKPDVVWATDLRDQLWRGRAGVWNRAPWVKPGDEFTEITQVWVRGPNDLWLITSQPSQSRCALYHGRWDPTR